MITYNKLFALLAMRGLKKTDLLEVISSPSLARLSKNETVNIKIVDAICQHLDVQPGDIMQYEDAR